MKTATPWQWTRSGTWKSKRNSQLDWRLVFLIQWEQNFTSSTMVHLPTPPNWPLTGWKHTSTTESSVERQTSNGPHTVLISASPPLPRFFLVGLPEGSGLQNKPSNHWWAEKKHPNRDGSHWRSNLPRCDVQLHPPHGDVSASGRRTFGATAVGRATLQLEFWYFM